MINMIEDLFVKNGLVFSFLLVGLMMLITEFLSKKVFKNKIPGVALAIILGLILAGFGKEKGISNIAVFSGMTILGGSMLRDFAIVSTALGASFDEIKNQPTGVGGEIQLTDAIARLMTREAVYAFQYEGKRYDCGSKEGFLEATVELALQHPQVGASFREYLKGLSL